MKDLIRWYSVGLETESLAFRYNYHRSQHNLWGKVFEFGRATNFRLVIRGFQIAYLFLNNLNLAPLLNECVWNQVAVGIGLGLLFLDIHAYPSRGGGINF